MGQENGESEKWKDEDLLEELLMEAYWPSMYVKWPYFHIIFQILTECILMNVGDPQRCLRFYTYST